MNFTTLGKEEFARRLEKGMNSFLFEARTLEAEYDLSDPQGKTDFFHELARRMASFEDEIERSNYIDAIARRYQTDPAALKKLVGRLALQGSGVRESIKPRSGTGKEKENGYEISRN